MHEEEGALAGLKIAQYLGKIDHIGISSHHLEVVEQAITCGEFEAVVLEYSAFYPESGRLLALAKEHDVGTIIMRPLGGSGRMTSVRGLAQSGDEESPISAAKLLQYVLSNPDVSVAIPGVRYPDRVRANVDAALGYQPMSDAEQRAFEAQASQLSI